LFTLATLGQSRNDLTQRQQTFIDVNGLFRGNIACLTLPLTSSQIDKLQSADHCVVGFLAVDAFECHLEHRVGSTACIVHVVGGDNLVLDTEVIQSQDILSRSALESIQVLDLEVVFIPFEFEARAICY